MSKRMLFGMTGGLTLFMLVIIGITAASVMARGQTAAAAQLVTPASGVSAPASNPVQAGQPAQSSDSGAQAALSPQNAAQIALNLVPGASLVRTPELVSYNGTVAYEVVLQQGTLYIDANSGKVLSNSAAQSTTGPSQPRQQDGEHDGLGGFFGGDDD